MIESILGNFLGGGIYCIYQIVGIIIISYLLKEERKSVQLLIGSVCGTVLFQWLPLCLSFLMGFNQISHLLALGILLVFFAVFHIRNIKKRFGIKPLLLGENCLKSKTYLIWLFIIPLFCYICYILHTHTILEQNGSLYTGQTTYGDMNMHLGFITSIAVQGKFPPEYSILPGTKLSYPFLCDSVSSSIYIFGASLRFSYIFPMLFAILQVFYGVYLFLFTWLKRNLTAILGWILFFFCGGFGFFYFLDIRSGITNFTRIFTEFYETPTNLVEKNIRWVNVVVDILIPQRASLFGWAVLIPSLILLYKISFEQKKYFVLTGILIGSLPMIHTHSFLTASIFAAAWCLCTLVKKQAWKEQLLTILQKHSMLFAIILLSFMEGFSFLQKQNKDSFFIFIPIVIIVTCFLIGIYSLVLALREKTGIQWIFTWGICFALILLLALPQLFIWTFQQTSNENFLKVHFNWGNQFDSYIWFYIKNMGIVFLLFIIALRKLKKSDYSILFPAFLIWILAEFIQFQPNEYDNNKLLYPIYILVCGVTANYLSILLEKKKRVFTTFIISICMISTTLSAILTMGREFVSKYELYDKNQVLMANYIKDYTKSDSVILTNTRHNNAVAALTGRNIVCGSGSFLYYHGLNYQQREAEIAMIYENIEQNDSLIKYYQIDYILVGPEERNSYPQINESLIQKNFTCIAAFDTVMLYQVN